jgi:hypothetical protein
LGKTSEGWLNSKSGGSITISPRRFLSLRSGQGDKEEKNDETRNDTCFDGLFGLMINRPSPSGVRTAELKVDAGH